MRTLFAMEELYGLLIDKLDGKLSVRLDKGMKTNYLSMFEMFSVWQEQSEKLKNGEISKEQCDTWCYNYPKYDETSGYAKVPSQELSDTVPEAFKEHLKDI